MRLVVIPLLMMSSIFISGCTSGPSEDEFAPKIGEINTQIMHLHESINESEEDKAKISISIRATITDPDGLGDIQAVYVYDSNNENYWNFKAKGELLAKRDCVNVGGFEVIQCTFYPEEYTDFIDLSGFQLVAEDLHTYKTKKNFEFKLPGGVESDLESFVYASDFQGGTANGVEALEAMSILGNSLEASLGEDNALTVSFEISDSRAEKYSILLYDDSESTAPVGDISSNAPALEGTPLNQSGVTEVTVPLSQISFTEGKTITDVSRVQVVLYDTPVSTNQLAVNSNWFNYSAYSEIFALTE